VNGSIIAESPGFYTFTWDNTNSWIAVKNLRFKVAVLEPVVRKMNQN